MASIIASPTTRPRLATPIASGLSVRCDSYNEGSETSYCPREVFFGRLGREIVGSRFLSDHVKGKGLTLYGFCENGHILSISHIDTIPNVANKDIVGHMAEGAIDLCGLNQLITSAEFIASVEDMAFVEDIDC